MAAVNETEIVRKANDKATKEGRYQYDCMLGRGAFGNVLKANDNLKKSLVAVKIIEARASLLEIIFFWTPAVVVQQGRREARLLINLQHENVQLHYLY